MRRSIFARVKFLSRLFTALNLLPSIATQASVNRPMVTERDKAGAHLPDGAAVVLAEVGNRLVIGNKAAREPHHLNVAPGLMLEPAARLNPIEVAVDVELRQERRMVRRPAGCLR